MVRRQAQSEHCSICLQKAMDVPKASLCFLSFPGTTVLNVQVEGKLLRFEITREQLARLIGDGINEVL